MTIPAIRVDGLGKRYVVSHNHERASYRTLRDTLTQWARSPFARRQTVEDFWALKDISFDVHPGEVVGIIGRNGAGKSTLLKILSRITRPTTGRAEINGRVGSLLEVGTGFHPELTGRENIFLNGSILGMSQREIKAKFDKIVAFAEVEKFLDTPVKRYSSGMYVRLAFSVAAHLEPEILIIDEVLAVGDRPFQNRCFARIADIARGGSTVLFVSHNIPVIRRFCDRGIVIDKGRYIESGKVEDVLRTYLSGMEESASETLLTRTDRSGSGLSRITHISIMNEHRTEIATGDDISINFRVSKELPGLSIRFSIYSSDGAQIATFSGPDSSSANTFTCNIHKLLLVPGKYTFNAALYNDRECVDHVHAAALLSVEEGEVDGRRVAGETTAIVTLPHAWHVSTH